MAATDEHMLRIGEVSRRTGVSTELLRAWERRYGLLRPARTEGGFRLYSTDDEQRVRLMQELLARGLSAAEAARTALARTEERPAGPEEHGRALRDALDSFDEQGAHLALDRLLASLTAETVLADVVVPYLHELGERWESGEATVAQEHFATHVLRGRLLGLARGWDRGEGPRAILACPPGELHDLALVVFGLSLRGRGWRITFLGPDTPVETLADTADRLEPELVVLSAVDPARFREAVRGLGELAARHRVALAGAGADDALARRIGAELLAGDPVAAADGVAAQT